MGRHYRPIDLARAAGLSAQMVRNYEELGFLPPAPRGPAGHRRYGAAHVRALEVARVLIAGYSWQHARHIMGAAHRGDTAAALAAADARHADLHRRRRDLEGTLDALRVAAASPSGAPPPAGRGGHPGRTLSIGEAAQEVGVRVSALRFWEAQGVLQPTRDKPSGYRVFDSEQLRQLRVVALLRDAGYGFAPIRGVLAEMAAGRPEQALAAAERRLADLTEASRRCSAATAALSTYLEELRQQ